MKPVHTIPFLGLILAMASTSASAQAVGYIRYYFLPDCTATSTPGGETDDPTLVLLLNECVDITPRILSFEGGRGGLPAKCPAGKTSLVSVFPQTQCRGNAVSAGLLPANGSPGDCINILLDTSGGVSFGGRSAEFTCV